jgi:aconitate decarboxylase
MKLVDVLLDHALASAPLPAAAVQAAVVFITDSVAVGLAGGRHPRVPQVRAAASAWGHSTHAADSAREWTSGTRWPAATAALLNAYQIHNQEFDCVHEGAVVHPLATVLPALVAQAERQSAAGRPVNGMAFIEAVVLAVDVAATIGCAQIAPMRFFRPALCGALGASLGLARLAGCNRAQMKDVLGMAYSQLAGTMQAHTEGSPMLALQIGLAARAACTALDLGLAGFSGPHDVLEGPYGYFELFDAPLAPRIDAVRAAFAQMQRGACIQQLSHKPFPTGRAAHGALDGLATLRAQHGFGAADVQRIELAAPPLIRRLIGRPLLADMDVNYARLCLPFLAATLVLRGDVTLADFSAQALPAALADSSLQALAARVWVVPNDCTDVNALAPQTLTVSLHSGLQHRVDLPAVLGHPTRPLSARAQTAKFDACCVFAGLNDAARQRLAQACATLPQATDMAPWVDALTPSAP